MMKNFFYRNFFTVSIIIMLTILAQFSIALADEKPPIPATIDLDPDTINLKSNGKWLTAYIELPDPYVVSQIDRSSIVLTVNGNEIPALAKPYKIGDYDADGKRDLMVKFNRQTVQAHMFLGPVELTVSGMVDSGNFEGNDTIKGIMNSKGLISATLLQTSDVHHHASGFQTYLDYTSDIDGDDVLGGYARLATLIDYVRSSEENMLLVDSGDFFMGAPYDMSNLLYPAGLADLPPIALNFFQTMQYDAVTLGNHDFDWTADGLEILLESGEPNFFSVPVVATNTQVNGHAIEDNIVPYFTKTLPNGLKVGILGLMGKNADEDAPQAKLSNPPIIFNHDTDFIQAQVNHLRNVEDVDIVIVLSHSGVEDNGEGEDATLAEKVKGIDIIASGHAHTKTETAFVKGGSNTVIFSPGAYGQWLSHLDFTYSRSLGRIVSYNFNLIDVDDSIGDGYGYQATVDVYNAAIESYLDVLGDPLGVPNFPYDLDQVIASTEFDLVKSGCDETALGNLAADAIRYVGSTYESDPFDIGIIATGVIRDNILVGKTGNISFADAYSVLPLGFSPDSNNSHLTGYPLLSIYVDGYDLYRLVLAVYQAAGVVVGCDNALNYSGIRMIDYDFGGVLQPVIFLSPDPLTETLPFVLGGPGIPIQPNDFDKTTNTADLYHVVVDLYAVLMIDVVNNFFPDDPLKVRNADGAAIPPFPAIMAYRIDMNYDEDPDTVEELKEWMALIEFLNGYIETTYGGITKLKYGDDGSAMGRLFP